MPTEILVLDEQNDRKGNSPVSQQRHEIADNGRKVVLARNGKNSNDQRIKEGPDKTRHSVEIMAQKLQRQTTGVVDSDVIPKHGESKEHKAELAEASWVERLMQETAKTMVEIGVGKKAIYLRLRKTITNRSITEASTYNCDEDGRNGDAPEGEREDLP
jgi:hypothetical protein